MKVLILNSGMGSRMGDSASRHPKCLTEIGFQETILSRQLQQIENLGLHEIVITTGRFENALTEYCKQLELTANLHFVHNPLYAQTNYIYSIYCAKQYLNDDILLMHGDLVFENEVLDKVLDFDGSCMVTSSVSPIPLKDFKAVVADGKIEAVGVDFFENAVTAQPLYKIQKRDMELWLSKIEEFCVKENVKCYAEDALNEISHEMNLYPLDIKNLFCKEIDTQDDLTEVANELKRIKNRTVYLCFSADILHSGHISIINKAKKFGKIIVGVLSDEAVASYKRYPLLPYSERKSMFENLKGVYRVVPQKTLSYRENLEQLHPDYVVHGDDWTDGFQKPIRDEVVSVLAGYGGRLIEFPYSKDLKYELIEKRARADLSMPDMRRLRLKRTLEMKGFATVIEAHNGITGLIAEKTVAYSDGAAYQFDAMWVSSLCDSIAKGKPDIELVDMSSRYRTVDDIMEVTTKPIIFDGDTGGLPEHFVYTVKTLERMGVSMIVIEDKIGLKKNSLFGNEVVQEQDSIEHFCKKIKAGKKAQKTQEFMICARIESLILEQGMEDALTRAFAYVEAGADAIMIHSRKKEPAEIFDFIEQFRTQNKTTPIVVIPTTFHSVVEKEFIDRGANIIIYANQLTRAGFPAMQKAALMILENHRAKECDDICMPIKDVITLIPEEE